MKNLNLWFEMISIYVVDSIVLFCRLLDGIMGREKYEPPRSGRKHTIMSQEDQNNGKANSWDELEIKGFT